ncbi:MAG: hypothetical protein Q4F65_09020 [Propionibacteriaceae bacterium]|nr:hypothetical protein [Propionibacteriaceae bacterium]
MSWTPIAADTPLRDLIGTSVVAEVRDAVEDEEEDEVSHVVVARFRADPRGVRIDEVLRRLDTGDVASHRWGAPWRSVLPEATPLDAALLALRRVRTLRAAQVPVRWPAVGGRVLSVVVAVLIMVPVLWRAFAAGDPGVSVLAVVYGPLVGALFWPRRTGTPSLAPGPKITDDWRDLTPRRVLELLPSAPPLSGRGPTPADRAGVVRARYGELLSDVIYRIENSALFDASVPQTQRFQLALLAWDPAAENADALATELEESFAAARRIAEDLGLEHLPTTAREPARRAALVVTTALGTEEAPEREAAARKAADLLNDLALYYLPAIDPGVPSLVGERRAILP